MGRGLRRDDAQRCGTTNYRRPAGSRSVPPSQPLMHVEHDAVGVACRRSDKHMFHQPAVFRGSGLELRHGAEIDQFRIDRFAAFQPLHQLDRPKTNAAVLDIDHRAVVGLEGVFGFEFDQFTRPDDLEVRAERADLAVDIIAAHLAADHRNDPAHAMTGIAGGCHAADMGGDGEDVSGFEDRGHLNYPIMRCGSQVASSGNRIRITSLIKSVTTNGSTPMKMVDMSTSLITLLITNTFMPTGG